MKKQLTIPGPVVLLTGGSTGLGLAMARRLIAEKRWRLILTARQASLERFEHEGLRDGPNLLIRPLEVTDPVQREAVVTEAHDRWGGVDALINNAGIAYRSVIEHVEDDDWHRAMETNCIAPMALTRLVLPGMREKRRGHIVNISSVGGMMAMPTMGLYSATKFALEGATESLWYEVRPWDIRVSLVEPGFIHSDSFRRTRYTSESQVHMAEAEMAYHAHYHFMADFIGQQMGWTMATPERVAGVVVRALWDENPPLRIAATWDAVAFSMLRRCLPRRLYHWLLYRNLPRVSAWAE